jgi:hypothetical protein
MRSAAAGLVLTALTLGCGGSDSTSPAAAPTTMPTPTPTPAPRRTDTFTFTLPAGSSNAFVVGPVRARDGALDVTLNYDGKFIILACVGTATACRPFGGAPMAASFDIPSDFPAGPIQAQVYFNYHYPQPPGDATGTVSFSYNPQ